MRHWVLGLALALALVPAAAGACRLARVLAMDVSRSISATDFRIGRDGLVAALTDAEVRAAFLAGGPVALAAFDWDGPDRQGIVLPWRLIATPADLDRVAAEAAAWTRPARVGLTGTGAALLFARALLDGAPPCAARTIDLATDGYPNAPPSVAAACAAADFAGITVNGLAIGEHEGGLEDWLRAEVIRGPGAFVEVARRHTDLPSALRRKLTRELSVSLYGSLAAP